MSAQRTLFARIAIAAAGIAALVIGGAVWLWSSAEPKRAPATSAASVPVVAQAHHAETEPVLEPPQSPTAAPAPALLDTPLPEDDYLRQLDALSVTDKQAALTLAEKGDEWYSGEGAKAAARRAMRITLLVDLGRMPEARQLTRDFIRRYPDSPYRRLVQGVTGIHPRPSGPR